MVFQRGKKSSTSWSTKIINGLYEISQNIITSIYFQKSVTGCSLKFYFCFDFLNLYWPTLRGSLFQEFFYPTMKKESSQNRLSVAAPKIPQETNNKSNTFLYQSQEDSHLLSSPTQRMFLQNMYRHIINSAQQIRYLYSFKSSFPQVP